MIVRPAQPIAGNDKPLKDRRAVFVTLDNESGTIDLLIPQRNERFGQLRCIYIDTSAQDSSGNGCVIETDIGQNITALPNTQGYYPVFVPFVTKLKISSNQTVNVLLLDFDMRPAIWPTSVASSIVPNPLHVIIDGQPIAVDSTVQNFPTNYPVSQNSAWNVTQSGAWNVGATQSGAWSVAVNNFPANYPVSQNSAWNVAQSGAWNINALQSGAWSVAVNNFPSTERATKLQRIGLTVGGSTNIFSSSISNLCMVYVFVENLVATSRGNVNILDGSGNSLCLVILPTSSVASSFVVAAYYDLKIPFNNGGSSPTISFGAPSGFSGAVEVQLGAN